MAQLDGHQTEGALRVEVRVGALERAAVHHRTDPPFPEWKSHSGMDPILRIVRGILRMGGSENGGHSQKEIILEWVALILRIGSF